MNFTAPMQPNTATTENQVAIARLRIISEYRIFVSLGAFPAFMYAKTGKTKSSGVKPIAPQIATKSPKKGMAAAIRVIRAMYIEVNRRRIIWFRIGKLLVVLFDSILSSKYAYVGLQYI